jgi:hypothetical protein
VIFPDFCRILNLSFWFRRIFGFADYTRAADSLQAVSDFFFGNLRFGQSQQCIA